MARKEKGKRADSERVNSDKAAASVYERGRRGPLESRFSLCNPREERGKRINFPERPK